ncbi:MAG: PLD nuclease N-terminal domain-containing protein [Thermomicrobiales bacterium]
MSWQRALVALVLMLFAVCYYGLAAVALRDLLRRPAVRGDNKVIWGLVILCLPIVGALLYGYTGAASFLPRPHVNRSADERIASSVERREEQRGNRGKRGKN